MGLLDNVASYSKRWSEAGREAFASEDIERIDSIEVVPSQYGTSAKVSVGEYDKYYPLHRENPVLPVGTKLDKRYCTVVHLVRGEQTCEKLLYTGSIDE